MSKTFKFAGYTIECDSHATRVKRSVIRTDRPGDWGADPVGDGTFRMVPSGDVVNWDERCRRLKR